MSDYFRPLPRFGPARPAHALPLAGGAGWFTEVQHLRRAAPPRLIPASEAPSHWQARLSAPRPPLAGLGMERPHVMGILNTTPDSFSDGGSHADAEAALRHARAMAEAGATIIDIGGESTRPGATTVPEAEECARVVPAIRAMAGALSLPVSIDTRKAAVAEAAVAAGAALVNDVSGFTHDPALAPFCAARGLPVCVMHSPAGPETMQDDPRYDDVLLDVYDALAERVAALEAMGLPRSAILVDPGIGFGKTMAHNLTLLHHVSLFHGLGCGLLVGASRKGFIGTLSGANPAAARMAGSLAVALHAVAQGVQVVRVHDVAQTVQALRVWQALEAGGV
jgi:dihydropteroate synthase